ncbi:MAG: Ig-like domain-containing protein [Ilumatobacteraceae bacterium]|nr:Ig-like domain-containing protein [Ilumatobacteraceae bacterium]
MGEPKRKVILVTGSAVAAAAATPFVGVGTAHAAGFEVTNLNDSGAGSLRDAIEQANAAAGADIITFQAGLSGTIVLTTGQLTITDSVDIQGPGATVLAVSGNNASRVFYLYNNSSLIDVSVSGLTITGGNAVEGGGIKSKDETLTLDGVVISGNAATSDGGGLWADGFNMVLTIQNSTLSGNTAADDGGAIYVEDTGGPMLITDTVISGNSAADDGGGIYFYDPDDDITIQRATISGNDAGGLGGGIYLYSPDNGVFTIDATTISGNSAASGAGAWLYAPDHGLVIRNTTVSGNVSAGGIGGIYFDNLYDGVIEHSTITGNEGYGLFVDSTAVSLDHTIVAGNSYADLYGGGTFDANWSLLGTAPTSGADNIISNSPLLEPLADNGGPTLTHMPRLDSPALNAGDPAVSGAPATDQRGEARIVGVIDIGAVERAGSAAVDDNYAVAKNTTLNVPAPGVLGNDTVDGVPTVGLVTNATHGTLTLNADGSFSYTPMLGYHGTDTFVYDITDGDLTVTALPPSATVTITVGSNQPPVAVNDSITAITAVGTAIPVLANDSDPDGDPLSIVAVTQGLKGTVVIDGNQVRYTPLSGATGSDSFTYTISDGEATATATVTVRIQVGSIPATGQSSWELVFGATSVLGAGLVLTGLARRRSQPSGTR